MKKLDQNGFTIFELLISIAIASTIVTVLFAISLGFFGSTIRSQVTAEMAIDSHFMLRALVEDLRLGNDIGATNVLSDANAPGESWVTDDSNNVLIINRPATTSSNDIIYDSATGNPYKNEYIYFVSNNALYKRHLKNPSASGNSVSTTCPASAASNTCPADRKYSSYVDDMTLTFYDEGNNVTNDVSVARSVNVGLSMSRKVFGKTITFNNSIFTKLRN